MGLKEVVVATAIAAIAGLVRSEAEAWMPAIAQFLKRRALEAFSGALKERLDEEWEANLLAVPGAISKAVVALGFCWAALVIRSEVLQSALQKKFGMVAMNFWMNILLILMRAGFGWMKLRSGRGGKISRIEVYAVLIPSLSCVVATVKAVGVCVAHEYIDEKDARDLRVAIADFGGRLKAALTSNV